MNVGFQEIAYLLIGLAIVGFDVVMVRDVISHKILSTLSKALWVIVIILLPVVGAYIYFLARRKY
jgi:hypothetical protein